MRVAVVTGAGSGIGRAAAQALLDDGWHVVLAGRRRAALEETAAGRASTVVAPLDVTDVAAIDAFFADVRKLLGRIDLLFNNAGMFGPSTPFEAVTPEQWREVVATNLDGAFHCAQAAYRVMREQAPPGGRIINNGSVSAHVPRPGAVAYTATKHAITGLTRAIALEGRAHGIACGQIDVGNAATELSDQIARGVPQADGTIRGEPRMDVADVAAAVRYMAGLPPEANVLTLTVMATGMPYVGRG